MSLLDGFRVVQIGPGLAAAVCGRLLADVGAVVMCVDREESTRRCRQAARPMATSRMVLLNTYTPQTIVL